MKLQKSLWSSLRLGCWMICILAMPQSSADAIQATNPTDSGAGQFRSSQNPNPFQPAQDTAAANPASDTANNASNDPTLPKIARLLQPPSSLPNESGQIWRTYDISSYTRRITSVKNPEQAIVDWVLRETGTEIWFQQPMGMMNVASDRLHVYHTPEVHKKIAEVVDRMVLSRGQNVALGIRMLTVGRPDWRAAAFQVLQPFDVQTPGVEGWLISKENAAALASQLSVRSDYRPLEIGDLVLPAGQSHSFRRLSPQSYIRSLQFRANNPALPAAGGQYEPLTARFEEGYTLDVSPLDMTDGQMTEVVVKCQIDQLERLQSVTIPVPTINGQSQNLSTAVPQVVSWRLHERFRWPKDKVLLLSCGVIATPSSNQNQNQPLINLGPLLGQQRGRGDALLFIEYKGDPAQLQQANPQQQAGTFTPAGTPNYGAPYSNPAATGFQFQNYGNQWQSTGQANPNTQTQPTNNQTAPFQPSGNRMTQPGSQASVAIPTGPSNFSATQTANATGLFPITPRR